MSGLILKAGDRAYFLAMMRRQLNSAVHRRMNVLLLLDDGWEPRRIAEALYLDEGSVAQHRHRYEAEGRAGIDAVARTVERARRGETTAGRRDASGGAAAGSRELTPCQVQIATARSSAA